MTKQDKQDAIELAYAALAVYADDGTLDMEELNFLLGMALRDGVISDEEKNVLAGVFNRVHEEAVTARVWDRIQSVRRKYNI